MHYLVHTHLSMRSNDPQTTCSKFGFFGTEVAINTPVRLKVPPFKVHVQPKPHKHGQRRIIRIKVYIINL